LIGRCLTQFHVLDIGAGDQQLAVAGREKKLIDSMLLIDERSQIMSRIHKGMKP
jgi:hypothetical protein